MKIKNNLYCSNRYGYNYLILLSILYILTFPLIGFSLHKPIVLGWLHLPASALIYPLTFFLSDIITERYGYQVSRQLIWCQIPGTIYYQSIMMLVVYGLPFENTWHHQDAYEYIFGGMGIIGYFGDFGLVIAFFLNSYLISKWKILFKGRYFWLRIIGASSLGETIQLFIGLTGVYFAKIWPTDYIISLFFHAIIFRLCMNIILSIPAHIVSLVLRKFEQVDIYDHDTNFNPFRFKITYQTEKRKNKE